jgi:Rrf2 family nitric oxide-sensitive transcriptional repressor
MTLSKFSDYSFRILIYLGNNQEKLITIEELSEILNLSTHHLKKIINKLANYGYIKSLKGRGGGIKLGMSPSEINLGKLLEITEDNLSVVECFSKNNTCNITKVCKLKPIIKKALNSFVSEFYNYTLEDLL